MKYVYLTKRTSDVVGVLKYKVVYENKDHVVILAKSGNKPEVVEKSRIFSLNEERGKEVLADILIRKKYYWGQYFDANPFTVENKDIILAKQLWAKKQLEYRIKNYEDSIKKNMEIIEKYKQEIKDYELKLQNLDNIEMELVDDTTNI